MPDSYSDLFPPQTTNLTLIGRSTLENLLKPLMPSPANANLVQSVPFSFLVGVFEENPDSYSG